MSGDIITIKKKTKTIALERSQGRWQSFASSEEYAAVCSSWIRKNLNIPTRCKKIWISIANHPVEGAFVLDKIRGDTFCLLGPTMLRTPLLFVSALDNNGRVVAKGDLVVKDKIRAWVWFEYEIGVK